MEPPHGFPLELFGDGVEINKKHLCSHCGLILRDPMQVICGHRFCKECFQQCVAQKLACPECIKDGAEDSDQPLEQGFQDYAIKREMAQIPCKCYFGECPWTGTFKDFESVHYNTCSFRPGECPICHKIISKTQARSSQSKEPASIESQVDHVVCLCEEIRRLREIIGINVEGDRGSSIPILEQIFRIEQTFQNIRTELSAISNRTEQLSREKTGETSTEKRGNRNEEGTASAFSDEGKVKVIENVLIVLNREFESLTAQVQKLERQKNATDSKVNALERQLQIKDVTIAEQDRRILELEQTTFDGTLVWRIADFTRRREDMISGRATSVYSPFYRPTRQAGNLARAERMQPPRTGFQLKLFGDDADINKKHLCSRCMLILRDPKQVPCGHRFCKDCFQQCVAQKLSCPECIKDGAEGSDQPLEQGFQDNAMKREMAHVPSKCYFEGCSWTGTFKDFESVHYNTCSFRPGECPICHKTISRIQARSSQSMEPVSIEFQVDHAECLFEEIRKLKEKIGVNGEGDRGSLAPILERIFQIERRFQDIWAKLSSTETTGEPTTEKPGNRTEEGSASGSSDNRKMKVIENVLIVYSREIEDLTSQVQNLERQKNATESKMNALERQLRIRIEELDSRILEVEDTTFNGTLVWKISDFSRKRADAISGRSTSFYSPAFYTSKEGYKMCARIYLNGDGMGKGTHVSLFFVVMRGQYDALLTWPFHQKVTLMFLDQDNRSHVINAFRADPTSNSFRRPTTEMNIASGCPLFMPISQLDSRVNAYVKDNVAFVKVIVSQE